MALFRPTSVSGSSGGTSTTASYITSSGVDGPYGMNSILSASYALTASYALSGGGGSPTLADTLLTNITVGGSTAGTTYTAGTLLETVLRDILIDQISAGVNFTELIYEVKGLPIGVLGPSGGTREVSSSISFNTASFSATAHNPGGAYPLSASFTASGANLGNFSLYLTNGPLASTNQYGLGITRTINMSTSGPVTFTINAIEPVTLTGINDQITLTYLYPFYYGMTATDYSTTGNIDGNLTKLLEASGNKTVSINGTLQYVYFAYPATYSDLTSIKDGSGFEVITSFTKYTRTQTGSFDWSTSYKIYKSNTGLTTVSPAQNYIFTF